MLEMSMVRGVGGVCDMCMCLAQGGSILEEHGESGICVCVLIAVVCVVLGESGRAAWSRVWEGDVVLCLSVM